MPSVRDQGDRNTRVRGAGPRRAAAERVRRLRDRLSDRWLAFKPKIVTLPIGEPPLRVFIGTPQAQDWYDPIQPHNLAEFAWVLAHLAGRPEKIIDAGAYHGLYTLVFARAAAPGSEVVAIDPVPSNVALIEVNLALNGLAARIEPVAVSARDGHVRFAGGSCGQIVTSGGSEYRAMRLASILPDATVVKLDIEGAEFAVLPAALAELANVHTWLVEIHPDSDHEPEEIVELFRAKGYRLSWLNRATARVEPWPEDSPWTERSTLIALRP